GITNKKGMIRKTAHSYEKIFSGKFGQIRDNIILEVSWLGNYKPFETGIVSSLIYEAMYINDQFELINKFNLEPFNVFVLSPERTICEKIMSLVRFSFSNSPITDLSNKIRHIYDIHMMLKNNDLNVFFNSIEFDEMLIKVANDDVLSFKNNNSWLINHPTSAIIFAEPVETWNKIKNVYFTSFKDLVFGEFPIEKNILDTLIIVSKRLKSIEWKIKIERT
ncbi:MAG: nucleotidyl transferase AbiEii/AbiGii toxin family protein, partial [FCB group bacterium]|nr:nucleotidyl transferase AbiEii/AbiGii toxin family protein [FCB group bacterium]